MARRAAGAYGKTAIAPACRAYVAECHIARLKKKAASLEARRLFDGVRVLRESAIAAQQIILRLYPQICLRHHPQLYLLQLLL